MLIIRSQNGMKHEFNKFLLAYEATATGEEYYTEAEFPGGRIADFINLDNGLVTEVADSESDESLKEKEGFYKKLGLKFEVKKVF